MPDAIFFGTFYSGGVLFGKAVVRGRFYLGLILILFGACSIRDGL